MNERAKMIAEKMKRRQGVPDNAIIFLAGENRQEPPQKAPSRPAKASKPFIPFRYPPETTIHLRWDGTQWIAVMSVLTGEIRQILQLNHGALHESLRGLARLYRELTEEKS